MKTGLYAVDVRAADFAGLKNRMESRGWPELVLANGLLTVYEFFQAMSTSRG